jgi:hypothetical protein
MAIWVVTTTTTTATTTTPRGHEAKAAAAGYVGIGGKEREGKEAGGTASAEMLSQPRRPQLHRPVKGSKEEWGEAAGCGVTSGGRRAGLDSEKEGKTSAEFVQLDVGQPGGHHSHPSTGEAGVEVEGTTRAELKSQPRRPRLPRH